MDLRAPLLLALTLAVAACDSGDSAEVDPGADVVADSAQTDVLGDAAGADATADDAPDSGEPDAHDFGPPPETLGEAVGRPAKVVVPDDYDGTGAWPLVVMLHGFTANAWLQDALFGLSDRVSSRGFILLMPDGTTNPKGDRFWNASPSCCDFYGSGVDDVAYLRGLVEEAAETLAVDAERVSFVGHSNGGFMALRMACDAADITSAAVSLAGADPLAPEDCDPAEPVSVLQIHGTEDETIPYEGGAFRAAPFPGAEATAALWRGRDGCGGEGAVGDPVDYDDRVAGAETTPTLWTDCDGDARVGLWRLEGSGHLPLVNDTWRKALLDFALGAPVE